MYKKKNISVNKNRPTAMDVQAQDDECSGALWLADCTWGRGLVIGQLDHSLWVSGYVSEENMITLLCKSRRSCVGNDVKCLSNIVLLFSPSAYGSLTVRSLLDTREHCLNEFNFPDPYSKVWVQLCAFSFSSFLFFSSVASWLLFSFVD